MAGADVVISAAGTSAWDICTLGVPAVLVAVVDNQRKSMRQAISGGLALGLDIVAGGPETLAEVAQLLGRLLDEVALRRSLSVASRLAFDGNGASRVVTAVEAHVSPKVNEVSCPPHP
jgi:spore coat polysaccharide biosynthesis predicted glycosyltransferase SpsG